MDAEKLHGMVLLRNQEVVAVAKKMGLAKFIERRCYCRNEDLPAVNEAVSAVRVAAGRQRDETRLSKEARAAEEWRLNYLELQLLAAIVEGKPPPAGKRPPEPRYDGDVYGEDGYGYGEWATGWAQYLANILRKSQ